ncbi:MAG TPA: hypothetical protein VGK17_21585, partial [Propionicimonas sp.]
MQLALHFTEALAVVTSQAPLPPMVQAVRAEGSTVHAEIDPARIPDASAAIRIAAAALGTVPVTARLAAYADGVATVEVTAHARGLPAHRLVPYLVGPITAMLRDQGLPDGLIEIERGETATLVRVQVQRAVDTKVA